MCATEQIENKGSIVKRLTAGFLRLKIAEKILLGYLPLALLIILIAVYSLSKLEELSQLTDGIIKTDVSLLRTTDEIKDALLAQEFFGHRYFILEKSLEHLQRFREESERFDDSVVRAYSLPGLNKAAEDINRLISLHEEYNNLFAEKFEHKGNYSEGAEKGKLSEGVEAGYDEQLDSQIESKQEEILALIDKISAEARLNQNRRTPKIANTLASAFQVILILCVFGILIGIVAAVLITRSISNPINQLKLATQQISDGKFDHVPAVKSQDELGDLSKAFNEMAKRLKQLDEMHLDTNPLTRLPGGVAIENVLKKRIETREPMAFCFIDINNFKSFNDRYGYARGNEVIQTTAGVIETAVAEHGTDKDFIGHIGGDDFVVATSLEKYERICNTLIETFDRLTPDFYDPEDRNRGYIVGETRQGKKTSFPFIALSIAIITNQSRTFRGHIEIGEIAAELKEYLKSLSGSTYVVDRRGDVSTKAKPSKKPKLPRKVIPMKKAKNSESNNG